MTNAAARLLPIVGIVLIVAAFMTADKLWLHWYTPDTSSSSGQSAKADNQPEAVSTVAGSARTPPSAGSQSASPTAAVSSRPPAEPTLQLAADRDAFAVLWLVGQQATYKVRYQTSAEGGDEGDSYVVFNLAPRARVDTIPAGSDTASVQIAVDGAGKTIGCSSEAGNRDCVDMQPFGAPLPLSAGPIVFPPSGTFGTLDIKEVDGREVANENTRCFSIASPSNEPDGDLDYCFSASGVPLYAKGPTGVVEASELSGSVSDADFDISP